MAPIFLPGLELSVRYYAEVVRPIIDPAPHCAARLGWGSDVLGFDTVRSTDHGWGPRLQIFVAERIVDEVRAHVDAGLPTTFMGWPTRYGWDAVEPRHWVEVSTLEDWLLGHFGYDPRPAPTTMAWLTTPTQLMLGMVRGAVFRDPAGDLAALRVALRWYPEDVWRYALMSGWQRIEEEEHFVGRTAEVGDVLGSQIVTARLVRDVMKLAFLIERRYAPYSKWFGSEFDALGASRELAPLLRAAVEARTHEEREAALVGAYGFCAERTNALALCEPVDPSPRVFHTRPFAVIGAKRIVESLRDSITDPVIRALPAIGTIDQWSDNVDLLTTSALTRRAREMYGLDDA